MTPSYLSRYRKALSGLASLTSEYLPNVADPVETLRALAGSDSQQESDKASEADLIASIKSSDSGKYVFVSLSSAEENESIEDMLRRHDALILAVSQALTAAQKKAVFIYTGEPSMARTVREVAAEASPASVVAAAPAPVLAPAPIAAPAPIKVEKNPPSSHDDNETKQLADQPKTYTYFIRDRVLILFQEISYENERINISSISVTEVNPYHINVELIAASASDNIAFNISGSSGYWNVDSLDFRGQVHFPIEFTIAALDTFSWHCSPSLILQRIDGTISPLKFTGLQLEPVFGTLPDNRRTHFSDPWDCVGFTSAGIWGGLFIVILMLSILSVGISWIMDIRTMDRFDDPKGKTIIVSTTE